MTREEAIKILEMFLHKQCDLERTKFAYSQEEIWHAVKMATESLELDNNLSKDSKWIPCSERLPKKFELVLIQNIHGVMSVASRTGEKWFNFQGIELWQAVAWQPLPEPYKEGDT